MRKFTALPILWLLVACSNSTPEVVKNDAVIETTTTTTIPPTTTTVKAPPVSIRPPSPPPPVPPVSGSIGRIKIASIGVDWAMVEGIELSQLNKGPGHYPHSPPPCFQGNAAIAGHRTTYGAPFNKLDLMKDGDIINIESPRGNCSYKYLRTEIVSPTNIDVVLDKGGNFLTLTACHPKGSARQRIVVTAQLI